DRPASPATGGTMAAKKSLTVVFSAAVVSVMMFAGIAYACTNLPTLNLSTASGNVGDNVTVTGSSFRIPRAATDAVMPVSLSWNGAGGPVLATAVPDAAGNISATFTIPEGQAGYYVVLATQLDAKGVDAYGTPTRAAFQILGANGESAVSPAGLFGLGALGLGLFAAGFTAFARQTRRQEAAKSGDAPSYSARPTADYAHA
ncbi:MAG: hypothetical protein M3500_04560, partial [Actinomycetota bacterium]|nr:hypothetical protein [Actinomycetota bacterium]